MIRKIVVCSILFMGHVYAGPISIFSKGFSSPKWKIVLSNVVGTSVVFDILHPVGQEFKVSSAENDCNIGMMFNSSSNITQLSFNSVELKAVLKERPVGIAITFPETKDYCMICIPSDFGFNKEAKPIRDSQLDHVIEFTIPSTEEKVHARQSGDQDISMIQVIGSGIPLGWSSQRNSINVHSAHARKASVHTCPPIRRTQRMRIELEKSMTRTNPFLHATL